ncbi:hypothetical protein [Streptomyces litmocidini]|uniref:Uncharacterized protein n=1 Tax=Streptomyces litmocidini TaxID=67318 RepID=A0ABW7U809_9ACTN
MGAGGVVEGSGAPSGTDLHLGEAAQDVHGALGVPGPPGLDEQRQQKGSGIGQTVVEEGVSGGEVLRSGVDGDGCGAGQGQGAVERGIGSRAAEDALDARLHRQGESGGGGLAGDLGESGGLGGQGISLCGGAFVDVGPDGLTEQDLGDQVRPTGRLVDRLGEQFVRAVQALSARVEQGQEGADALSGTAVLFQDEAGGGLAAREVAAVRGVAYGGQCSFGEQPGALARGAFGGEEGEFGGQ